MARERTFQQARVTATPDLGSPGSDSDPELSPDPEPPARPLFGASSGARVTPGLPPALSDSPVTSTLDQTIPWAEDADPLHVAQQLQPREPLSPIPPTSQTLPSDSSDEESDDSLVSVISNEHNNMVLTSAPTQEEKAARQDLISLVESARGHLNPPPEHAEGAAPARPNLRVAKLDLDSINAPLSNLQTKTTTRLGKLSEEEAAIGRREWVQWRSKFTVDWDEQIQKYESLDPALNAAQQSVIHQKQAAKDHAEQQVQQTKDFIGNVYDDLQPLSLDPDYAMTKLVWENYMSRFNEAKRMIRPGISDAYNAYLQVAPEQSNTIHADCTRGIKDSERVYNQAMGILHRVRLAEDTLNVSGNVNRASTPASDESASILSAAAQANLSRAVSLLGNKSTFRHQPVPIPVFDGTPTAYPHWKQQMQEDIMPGNSEATQIRLISQYSPHKDIWKRFNKVVKAWDWFDSIYADQDRISEEYCEKFLNRSHVPGRNDQEKLVAVLEIIQTLHNTLEAVNMTKELTDQKSMVSKAVRLLPLHYRRDFTQLKQKKIDEGVEMTTNKTYNLLNTFLENEAKLLNQCGVINPIYGGDGASAEVSAQDNITSKGGRDGKKGKRSINNVEVTKSPSVTGYGVHASSISPNSSVPSSLDRSSRGKGSPGGPTPKEVKKIESKWKEWGKCPCCGAPGHIFSGARGWSASSSLANCKKWRDLPTDDDRADFLIKHKLCVKCASWIHKTDDCTRNKPGPGGKKSWLCYVKDTSGNPCNKEHSVHIHSTSRKICSLRLNLRETGDNPPASPDVMLPIVGVQLTDDISTAVLLDSGSNCSVITNSLATRLGLKGIKTLQNVTVVNEPAKLMEVTMYELDFKLYEGSRRLSLVGLDSITTSPGEFCVEVAYEQFPHCVRGTLEKPAAPVELLIGMDHVDLVGSGGSGRDLRGNLKILSLPFPPGVCLTGSHPRISFINPPTTKEAFAVTRADRVEVDMNPLHPACVSLKPDDYLEDFRQFMEGDMMAYSTPRKCKSCANCQSCSITEEGMSVKEFMELQRMEQNIWHDPELQRITVSYPIVGDITKFKDNFYQAKKRASDLRRSLEKRNMLSAYEEQIDDYIARGVWEEVSEKEIQDWKEQGGYIHFVAHHPVENPTSLSTKIRIVVDSTVKNCYTGPDLNSLYAKGPNQINSLYNVLVKWRSYEEVAVADLAKAYHSLHTTRPEFFMRLVTFWSEVRKQWIIWGHTRCGMGDKPSSTFLELAKKIASNLALDIDEVLAPLIISLSYVDDSLLGGSEEDVMRFRGEVTETPEGKLQFDGTLPQVFAKIGMKIKNICVSGETDQRILDKQGKVLGLTWWPTEDVIVFKLTANVTPRKGSGRLGPDLTSENIAAVDSVVFTKRIAVSLAAYNFDPLGLISCFLVKLKIALKEIVAREYAWDVVLDEDLQKVWRNLLREILSTDNLQFPRSVTHVDAKGRPELIVFSDGSTLAFGAVIYIRWPLLTPGTFHTALVTSCSRVTPKTGMTPPRSELQGLVVAVRMTGKIIKHLSVKPCRVTLATDSQCSVAACDVNANSLAVFFSNRVIEIISTMENWGHQDPAFTALDELTPEKQYELGDEEVMVDLIQHTPGELNPADWPTRGNVSWADLGPASVWQLGPSYLHQPRSSWPFSRNFVSTIPQEERRKKFQLADKISAGLFLHSFSVARGGTGMEKQVPGVTGLLDKAVYFMELRNDFIRCRAIAGRYIRMLRLRDSLYSSLRDMTESDAVQHYTETDPGLDEVDLTQAEWLFQLASQPDLLEDLKKKANLASLSLFFRDGIARMRGRLAPSDLKRVMGYDSLVVLSRHCRLAYLIMLQAHKEDHRASPGDSLYRSRKYGYWIVRGRTLAEKIVRDCGWCSVHYPTFLRQKMADLPRELSDVPVRAFSNVCVDYMGSVRVMYRNNATGRQGNTTAKAYPIVFSCMNSGAVHLQLATDYSTEGFLTQWIQFCSLRGTPRLCHADMGSQLVAAGKKLREAQTEVDGDLPNFNWKEIIAALSSKGTEFRHALTQAQWRNGRAESAVRACKKTLKHLYKGNRLTYAEFSSLLSLVANRINDRPLGVRHHGGAEGDVCVITPNLLIQGGRGCSGGGHDTDFRSHMGQINLRLKVIESAFMDWWVQWFDTVWESLVPVQKWRQKHRNVAVGDIVIIKYESSLKDPVYRRGRVVEVHPDEHGLVRDATVVSRSKWAREKPGEYKVRKLDRQLIPVQRLAVLLAAEEVPLLEKANERLHFCTEDARLPLPSSLALGCDGAGRPSSPPARPALSEDKRDLIRGGPKEPAQLTPVPDSPDSTLSLHSLSIYNLATHLVPGPASDGQEGRNLCWECETRDRFYYVSTEYD